MLQIFGGLAVTREDYSVFETTGARIAGSGEGNGAYDRINTSQCTSSTKRPHLCVGLGWRIFGLQAKQFAVGHTDEGDDDIVGDAGHGFHPNITTQIWRELYSMTQLDLDG
ncbi:hypothetical protein GCM10007874_31930 [Labrys miyagiensis]|uniref:Uncharacterized protein n=1 Tax=Labrys miyagiensis TaxID=346912 RepID=A0ABQ6CIT4_9HYPH|nr:hypothetical protein [Labrys miyagiensis]GLS20176.1 hypothetical protein GCM10007874_31930 [Labrys miyagiensis]